MNVLRDCREKDVVALNTGHIAKNVAKWTGGIAFSMLSCIGIVTINDTSEAMPARSITEQQFPNGMSPEAIMANPSGYIAVMLETGQFLQCSGTASMYDGGNIRSAPFVDDTMNTLLPRDSLDRTAIENPKLLYVPQSEQEGVSSGWLVTDTGDGQAPKFINEVAIDISTLSCSPTNQ